MTHEARGRSTVGWGMEIGENPISLYIFRFDTTKTRRKFQFNDRKMISISLFNEKLQADEKRHLHVATDVLHRTVYEISKYSKINSDVHILYFTFKLPC